MPQQAPNQQPEQPLLQLMYPATNPVRRSARANKGTTSRFADYDVSSLSEGEQCYDWVVQAYQVMQGIQSLYTLYHALAGFNQQYARGILHQPSQSPAYSTPAPQYTSYQTSQDSANTVPVLQLVKYEPLSI